MADIGRISGPLLKDNLVRNGVDLAFDTDLLYLNVNDNKIGIKTDSPVRELEINNSVQTTNLIVDNLISVTNNIEIDNNSQISTTVNPLYISAGQSIHAVALKVDNIKIDNNRIETTLANTDLELRPTKGLVVNSSVTVYADLHATGNVTFDGDVTFGSDDTDSVSFNADVASDLIPDLNKQYTLGSQTKKWNSLYAQAIRGDNVVVGSLAVPAGINYGLRFTNALFVSTTGSNSNQGDHFNSPYRNINYALSQATAGDTVYIFPGTYNEIFPLTVPAGVSVIGFDLRDVIIRPTELTKTNDAFLLNGECTVSDLTIKDFFYNLEADTGYAFRFAPNFSVTSRSPYVQNCTVITSGSVTSAEDPKGFLQGDAGRGALIDGSVASASSKEASMLFHSCTFITPNADTITATNGVRVEWLNSFTYFAKRGLYATNGLLGFASLATKFGAEIRSIASANVYGTYGTVADGASTLMYLINHNFGYIGSNADSSNDQTLVNQANEVVELNNGKIYYSSQTHDGEFRVGDQFYVDLGTGKVSFDVAGIASNGPSDLTLISGNNKTFVDAFKVETGDFRLSGNTIETLTRAFNVSAANGSIVFDSNVSASKNIVLSGNFQTEGNLTFGNQTQDTITFNTRLSQDLNPDIDNTYDIGTSSKIWRDSYTASIITQDVKFSQSKIETTVLNSNLLFSGAGTGVVKVEELLFGSTGTINSTVTNSNITLTPNTGYSVSILGTGAFKAPRTTSTLTRTGSLRFNTTTGLYDGYSSALVGLGGVMSSDRQSSVFAHLTNDTLNFKVDNQITTTLSSTGLVTNALYTSTLNINNNSLITTGNNDLTLTADAVNIQSLTIQGDSIVSVADSNIELKTSGTGYVQFGGDKALEIPYGDNASRPTAPLVGNTRFNPEVQYMEVWDGSAWIPVTGTGELSSFEFANEESTIWSLVLG